MCILQKTMRNGSAELVLEFCRAVPQDLDELERLYDAVHDHLESHVNYPGWRRGIYPAREDAEAGIAQGELYVVLIAGVIAGTIILRQAGEPAYAQADWQTDLTYSDIFVVHTFAVHPNYLRAGIGRQLLLFVFEYAAQQGIKAVRLDVYENNQPAIRLYESCGFRYIDKVDLGYSSYGLDWFRLYQLLL